jgi:hypothetical protein
MAKPTERPLAEKVRDLALIDAAHERATREALLAHARAGRSVPISENGHVVWLTPEEIFQRYPDAERLPIESTK